MRICTRIILSTVGHPVTFFTDRRELVRAITDAVQIDKNLYAHGLLPCDISPSNILIYRSEGEGSVTRGCLIDLDLDLGRRQTASQAYPAFMEREFGEVAPILATLLRFYHDKGMLIGKVDADVSSSALRAMARAAVTKAEFPEAQSRALTYVNEAVAYMVNHRGADPEQTFTREMLKWDAVELPDTIPIFSRAASDTGLRQSLYCSGTLPFMSPEMLDPIPIFDNYPKQRQSIAHLHKITHCLFDAQDPTTLSKNKRLLLRNGVQDFKAHVERCFHDHFRPFKPTMRAYLQLLRIGYIFRGYEYHFIHDRVIELLRDLLEKLNDASSDEGQGEFTREVLKEREGTVKDLQ
ncbi:hypothetical protein EV122DRAFT_275483 [Schizophyllum commune]